MNFFILVRDHARAREERRPSDGALGEQRVLGGLRRVAGLHEHLGKRVLSKDRIELFNPKIE